MKTSIYDRGQNVFEVQHILREYYKRHGDIPLINPDGIFGSETTEAVKALQHILGMEATGIVDYPTWEKFFNWYFDEFF